MEFNALTAWMGYNAHANLSIYADCFRISAKIDFKSFISLNIKQCEFIHLGSHIKWNEM